MTRARMPRPHEVAAARRDPRLLRAVEERRLDNAWRARGVCRAVDPETFFPAPNESVDVAVSLCLSCDVQGPCLAWALESGDCHGIWGATTPRERRAMLMAWRVEVNGLRPLEERCLKIVPLLAQRDLQVLAQRDLEVLAQRDRETVDRRDLEAVDRRDLDSLDRQCAMSALEVASPVPASCRV